MKMEKTEINNRQKIKSLILSHIDKKNITTYILQKAENDLKIYPLGVSFMTINRILKNDNYVPSARTLTKIFDAIDVEYTYDYGILNFKYLENHNTD
tara:strand:- start:35 stop:325 length:291 start_codon:yes stop_codon:yes gene_type:complete